MNRVHSRRAVLVSLAAVVAFAWAWRPQPTRAAQAEAAAQAVTLLVSYREDVQKRWTGLAWREGMTVEKVLQAARELPEPLGLKFESKGQGERGFLLSIDGLANQGGGKGQRNWLYRVNDSPGQASFSITTVNAGDTIEWRFAHAEWAFPKP